MIQKELIWNISLLVFGAFLVFAFTFRLSHTVSLIPGWHSPDMLLTPLGPVNKWAAGLTIGVCLVAFKYINLAILSIKHPDFRLAVLLLSYSIPIFLVLIAHHHSMSDIDKQIIEDYMPVKSIDAHVKKLRQLGLFKKYKNEGDDFVSDVVMGRFIRGQGGYFNAQQLWAADYKSLQIRELLKLDTDKTWQPSGAEWGVEGSRAYEDFIKAIGNISEGNFKPSNIKETWLDRKTVELTFDAEGRPHKILPTAHNDWADTETILKYVNNLVKPKNYQFYYIKGEDILVIGLTEAEKNTLPEKLNIEFDNPN